LHDNLVAHKVLAQGRHTSDTPKIMQDFPKADLPAWLSLREASAVLGCSYEAVRQRVKRGTLRSRKGNDGLLRVLVEADLVQGDTPPTHHKVSAPTDPPPKADTQGNTRELVDLLAALINRVQIDQDARAAEVERLINENNHLRAERDRLAADLAEERLNRAEVAGKLGQVESESAAYRREAERLAEDLATARAETTSARTAADAADHDRRHSNLLLDELREERRDVAAELARAQADLIAAEEQHRRDITRLKEEIKARRPWWRRLTGR
jgi:hypothetical protein